MSLDRPELPRAGMGAALGNPLRGHTQRCLTGPFNRVRKGFKSKVAVLEVV